MRRGRFIAVYGVNNIGKSTQTNILVQRLMSRGLRVEYIKYPIYDLDPTGKMLDEILRGKKTRSVQQMIEFFPGTAVRRPGMKPRRGSGQNIFKLQKIEDKQPKQKVTEEELQMWYSLNRYQYDPQLRSKLDEGIHVVAEDYTGTGLAWGAAKGADIRWLESVNSYLEKPDVEILMDGERFLAGKEARHLHESSDRLINKARTQFQSLAKKHSWNIVNANQDMSAVSEEMWSHVQPLFVQEKEDGAPESQILGPVSGGLI